MAAVRVSPLFTEHLDGSERMCLMMFARLGGAVSSEDRFAARAASPLDRTQYELARSREIGDRE